VTILVASPTRFPFSNPMMSNAADDVPDRTLSLTPPSVIPECVVVVVDPVSTGAKLAEELCRRGQKVVRVWSDVVGDMMSHAAPGLLTKYEETIVFETVAQTVAALAAFEVCDVIVGCETGVLCADQLAYALGVRGNGIEQSALRRNKYLQSEAVRSAGFLAAYQALASSTADVDAFLAEHTPSPYKMVVKPVDGAGSEGVAICDSAEGVRAAYASLAGATNGLGLENTSVLLMEYLAGDEYVIDSVSRDCEHKVVAIWKYDKRVFYGAPVVYYGMRMLQLDDEEGLRAMVRYIVDGVLPALGIANGAVHSELKATPRGPVLIEANCRLHGGDGFWTSLSEACLGYSQVTALVDAYAPNADAYAALPATPSATRAHGSAIDIRSPVSGVVSRINEERLGELRALPSYLCEQLALPAVGEPIARTIDVFTTYGNINYTNADKAALDADYAAAQAILDLGLFEVEPAEIA